VNTTARLESTGEKNRIHVSQETADLIRAAGRGSCLYPRENKVFAKGLGEMQTYWVYTKDDAAKSSYGTAASTSGDSELDTDEVAMSKLSVGAERVASKNGHVIDWTVEILVGLLKEIAARRMSVGVQPDPSEIVKAAEKQLLKSCSVPMDEIKEIINLPRYDASKEDVDPSDVVIGPDVISQLKNYVECISDSYNKNPFHNFEHASHVTMSVAKLLKRIVAPTDKDDNERDLHDHTYGITSDPLTQFSVVMSALIHDVDHSGVPNTQLINEEARIATMYMGRSIAEQNSVNIAWDVLMTDQFEALRPAIYSTEAELRRFRQMVVHTVLATDIMDKELSLKRKERWNATFADTDDASSTGMIPPKDEIDRKATIVIEYLMQASDVAHTMQHWHVYRKWNTRLFNEMYLAYQEGRAAEDPSENWYKSEIGFFDFYVIPLAQKLKSCGIFGVSGKEYLSYAQQNRAEWGAKGQAMVEDMVKEMGQ
jgi:hypothetical protein